MFSDSFKVEKLKLNELNVSRKAEIESKIFPFKHFHDSPKRVFSFFGLSVSLYFFFVFSSSLFANYFQPASEQIPKKPKVNSSSFFSCLTEANHFQPANERSL